LSKQVDSIGITPEGENHHITVNAKSGVHASGLVDKNGKITQGYDAFRDATQIALTNHQIKTAWNALLIDFRLPSLEWLQSIKNKYRIFLFSNTNQIHYESFLETYFIQTGKTNFNDFFEKAYYSQEMGLRKPSLEPFIQILENHGLEAAETVFIDDTLKNIEAAQQVGIQTIHLQWPLTLPELDL
jgi:putative hydrolase of the HAD superfamily